MIVGMLSDAHGNVEGLLAGLAILRREAAARILYLGDAVGYLPGSAVVDAISADDGIDPIAGNHEAMLLDTDGAFDDGVFRFSETRRALGRPGMERIAKWPDRRTIGTPSGPVLVVHDGPGGGGDHLRTDADLVALGPLPWSIVCMGHTHRPFIRMVGSTLFVNVGSCGLPRDDGRFGAVAVLDTETGDVRIIRFDLRDATRRAMARVGPVHPLVAATMARRTSLGPEVSGTAVPSVERNVGGSR